MDKPSIHISAFLNFVAEARKEYKFAKDELAKEDALTQDLLHMIELDDLKYEGRAKVATQLRINRKNRRYYKDRIEELEPFIKWLDEQINTKAMNILTSQTLGAVRSAEKYHRNRKYIPRIIKENQSEAKTNAQVQD